MASPAGPIGPGRRKTVPAVGQSRAMEEKGQGLTGYWHPDYARSLAEFGEPRELPRCRGWILERPIPGFPHHDGMGCYPMFACQDWGELEADLEDMEDLVCLSLVTDPFGAYDFAYLKHCFKDACRSYKEHFVTDLSRSPKTFVSSHHRRYARKALRTVAVERCVEPLQFLGEWVKLYANLIQRHDINGITAFSERAFAVQLQIPGLIAFRAVHQGETVGMILWYVQGEVAYYHLGAYSPAGYELRASFALFWRAIRFFADAGLHWLNLGAGAGVKADAGDGLSRFKRGWSAGTRTAYFCGRTFDGAKYDEITRSRRVSNTDYFPAYRLGEFG